MLRREIHDRIKKHLDTIRQVEMDAEMRASARKLDSDIRSSLKSKGKEVETNSLLDRAKDLEAKIAKKHPTTAKVVGELFEALAKLGGG